MSICTRSRRQWLLAMSCVVIGLAGCRGSRAEKQPAPAPAAPATRSDPPNAPVAAPPAADVHDNHDKQAAPPASPSAPEGASVRVIALHDSEELLGSETRELEALRVALSAHHARVMADPPSAEEQSFVRSCIAGACKAPQVSGDATLLLALRIAPYSNAVKDKRVSRGVADVLVLRGADLEPLYQAQVDDHAAVSLRGRELAAWFDALLEGRSLELPR